MVDSTRSVVDALIRREPATIFEQIFYRRDAQNKQKRQHRDFLAEHIEFRHPIEALNEDEVEISDAMELLD